MIDKVVAMDTSNTPETDNGRRWDRAGEALTALLPRLHGRLTEKYPENTQKT